MVIADDSQGFTLIARLGPNLAVGRCCQVNLAMIPAPGVASTCSFVHHIECTSYLDHARGNYPSRIGVAITRANRDNGFPVLVYGEGVSSIVGYG